MTLPVAIPTRLEKAAVDNGFDRELPPHGFWLGSSLEAFKGELEELDVEIRPTRTEQIALRLSKDDLAALQALAKKRGVGHTTLARSVLEQWLAAVRNKVAASPRRPRPAT